MSISNYLEDKILAKVFNGSDFTVGTVYASLHTGDPGETGANELSTSGGYVRKSVGSWSSASGGAVSNAASISWPSLTAGVITHFGLWDAVSGGNFLWGGALFTARSITAGDSASVAVGDIAIGLD